MGIWREEGREGREMGVKGGRAWEARVAQIDADIFRNIKGVKIQSTMSHHECKPVRSEAFQNSKNFNIV